MRGTLTKNNISSETVKNTNHIMCKDKSQKQKQVTAVSFKQPLKTLTNFVVMDNGVFSALSNLANIVKDIRKKTKTISLTKLKNKKMFNKHCSLQVCSSSQIILVNTIFFF